MKNRTPMAWTVALPALVALLSLTAAGCSSADAVDNPPVFALDREATSGIAPVDPDRTNVLPAPLVRSLLQDLLTEHSDLSIEVMRQAVDGDVHEDSLSQLTHNTDQLTLTIGVVYGPEGAAAFDQLWTNHIEFFNDYAAAKGAGDDAAAEESVTSLGHYENDFSSFVDVATSGEADFHDVLHVLHGHVGQLLDQADAWADGDYERAIALGVEAHEHMDVIANALATGIGRQQPQVFPGDPAEPAAVSCAADQLAASTRISLLGTLAEAQQAGLADAVQAARVALAEQGEGATPAVVGLVDALDDGEVATPIARAAAQDAVRAALAVDGCEGFVVG